MVDLVYRLPEGNREGVSDVDDRIQREEIQAINQSLQKGDTSYLVDLEWIEKWKKYVGYDKSDKSSAGQQKFHPGPIDNSKPFKCTEESASPFSQHMIEGKVYSVVPEQAWTKLVSWYGMLHTSYPTRKNTQPHSLPDAGQCSMETVVLKQQNENGTMPNTTIEKETASTFSHSTYSGSSASGSNSLKPPRLCGLTNLGNTCYMNSALQCLSNTEPLTNYFMCQSFKKDINKDNPLGMKGAIAETYSELLRDLRSGEHGVCSPWQFKAVVERFAPRFSGYHQQDSQEFLTFLLDGLHEDLNRVTKKPYVGMTIQTMQKEEDMADEFWDKHLQRNDSIVVELFNGQLRSVMKCSQCNQVLKTFDPIMFLSLPVPAKNTCLVTVVVIRANSTAEMFKYRVEVPVRGTVADLKKRISIITQIKEEMLVVVNIYNHQFKHYKDRDSVPEKNDVYMYELYHPLTDPYWVDIPIHHKYRCSCLPNTTIVPTLISVPQKGCTGRQLHQAVMDRYSPLPKTGKKIRGGKCGGEGEGLKMEEEKVGETSQLGEGQSEDAGEAEDTKTKETKKEDEATEKAQREKVGKKAQGAKESPSHDQEILRPPSSGDSTSHSTPCDLQRQQQTESRLQVHKTKGEKTQSCVKEDNVAKDEDLFYLKVVDSLGTQEVLKNDTSFHFEKTSRIVCAWSAQNCYHTKVITEHSSCAAGFDPSENTTLFNCLDVFTKEKLGIGDPWFCIKCKGFAQATRKYDIWKLPPVLVIYLTRFTQNRYRKDKVYTLVHFPTRGLDMSNYVKAPNQPEPTYDLFAVTNHHGGMGSGHYTAYCKNKTTDRWYKYDDSHVSEITEDRVVTSDAYVLFYCCCDKSQARHRTFPNPPLAGDSKRQEIQENGTGPKDNEASKQVDMDGKENHVNDNQDDKPVLKRALSEPTAEKVRKKDQPKDFTEEESMETEVAGERKHNDTNQDTPTAPDIGHHDKIKPVLKRALSEPTTKEVRKKDQPKDFSDEDDMEVEGARDNAKMN